MSELSTLGAVGGTAVAGPVGALAGFGIGALADWFIGSEAAERQQGYTQENMATAYELGQKEEQNRIPNYVESLKAAGMSPALAAPGTFGAAGMSAPQGSALPITGRNANLAQSALQALATESQIEVNKSVAELNEAHAENLRSNTGLADQEFERRAAEDASINENIRSQARLVLRLDYLPEETRKAWQDILDADTEYNLGTLNAIKETQRITADIVNAHGDIDKAQFDRFVAALKVSDDKYLRAAADLPLWQLKQIMAQSSLIVAQTQTEYKTAEEREAGARKLAKEVDYLGTLVRKTNNEDLIYMYDQGEYGKFALKMGTQAVQSFAGGFGAGFGAGAGAGLTRAKSAPQVNTGPVSNPVPRASGLTGNGY